jgi:hypothetical protein
VCQRRDDDLLDDVKDLLFGDVEARIMVEMRTCATTGAPTQKSELITIGPAAEPPDEPLGARLVQSD